MTKANLAKIGMVESLWRYPVKSMKGEQLNSGFIDFNGLSGDRVFAFVDKAKKGKDSFPWFSARQKNDLLLYKPSFAMALDPNERYPDEAAFSVNVTTPSGKTYPLRDPVLLQELRDSSGFDFELRFSERGMQDSRPISIFSMNTAAALADELSQEIDHRRFRSNLYLRWDEAEPFFEDTLVGKSIQIGDRLQLSIVKKDPRCIIISMDPDTAEMKPEILKHVARKHQGCVGVYAAVLKDGTVKAGDPVYCLDAL